MLGLMVLDDVSASVSDCDIGSGDHLADEGIAKGKAHGWCERFVIVTNQIQGKHSVVAHHFFHLPPLVVRYTPVVDLHTSIGRGVKQLTIVSCGFSCGLNREL